MIYIYMHLKSIYERKDTHESSNIYKLAGFKLYNTPSSWLVYCYGTGYRRYKKNTTYKWISFSFNHKNYLTFFISCFLVFFLIWTCTTPSSCSHVTWPKLKNSIVDHLTVFVIEKWEAEGQQLLLLYHIVLGHLTDRDLTNLYEIQQRC